MQPAEPAGLLGGEVEQVHRLRPDDRRPGPCAGQQQQVLGQPGQPVGLAERGPQRPPDADDYLTKPFALAELLARLRALTRRDPLERPAVLRAGDLVLDPGTRTVRRGGTDIRLSPKEFALLHEFMRRPGDVLSRTHLIEHVWDFAYDGGSTVVDVYVRYLRDKIDRPFGRDTIQTVRGAGYRLTADA
ncbi:response regulator transcription factor [Actinomadura sp. B10D3]|uniref:response regulator transcription factor n=1 Tax=Actinomadura sp. B10D3 TaxID=3153557 RepID=UPI00325C79EE